MRTCTNCGQGKSIEDFRIAPRCKDGRGRQCKECDREKELRYLADPGVLDRRNAAARLRKRPTDQVRRKHLWVNYHLTVERYEGILESQDGVCAICKEPCPTGHNLSVDHDHNCCPGKMSCGECVRGLLCNRCNPMLGYAQDSMDRLEAARKYLEGHKYAAIGGA